VAAWCACLLLTPIALAESWQRHTIDNSSRGADGVRLADVNGDGLLDIATGWEEGGLIRVYLNPGPERVRDIWPAVTVGRVPSPEDAVLADLDGDKAMDVVSCCEGRNRTVFVHWAPADATEYLNADAWQTSAIPCTQDREMWMFALPLQMDGRHGLDLVLGSKGPEASVSWLQSPSEPRRLDQWRLRRLYHAGWIMSLQAVDMDADRDLDVLASDRKGAQRGILWLQNPGAAFTRQGADWDVMRVDDGKREVMFLAPGPGEVFCAARGSGIVHLRRSLAPHHAWTQREIPMPAGCGTGKGVAIGDIDGDGRRDLVFSCENAKGGLSGVRWLSQDAERPVIWTDHDISGPEGVKFDRLELLDLDHDGDLDVLTCEERDNLGVIWYENPTATAG
jgi:hypothetical protein